MKSLIDIILSALLYFNLVVYDNTILAQQIINPSGSFIVSQNMTVEYSIGEIAIFTLSGGGSSVVTEGLLQPNDNLSTSLTSNEGNGKTFIYPNPIVDYIIINSPLDFDWYEVSNLDGKIIKTGLIENNRIYGPDGLHPGCYVLTINSDEHNKSISFKIIYNEN